ncbi:MAG: hypothetical protein JSW67_03455 [Candidatus Latescibacterota bacterium]|nr:MAG: hypothetical protein JSW67_03455 [Candidatus Latescibacterota bacterium]
MLSSWLLRPVILLVMGVFWWGFIQQIVLDKPWGNNPGPNWLLWLLLPIFGVGFPLFFMSLRLIVEVRSDHVDIRYVPLTHRRIAFADIERAEPRTYRPITEYGGWGVKGWSRRKVAYSVSGNQGVDLHLRDGTSVMIGSREPHKLARALHEAMQRGREAR